LNPIFKATKISSLTKVEFEILWPTKFQNKTNGVTPRRWVLQTNPSLSEVITKKLGTDGWTLELELLSGLHKYVDDPDLHKDILAAKRVNKVRLANYIRDVCGVEVPVDALFDVHIKRIHEYKRQYLNILRVIYEYNELRRKAEIGSLGKKRNDSKSSNLWWKSCSRIS